MAPDRPAAAPAPGRSPLASACEPYRELIETALGRGRDAMAIWQDLVDGHGFPAEHSSDKGPKLTDVIRRCHCKPPQPWAR